MLEIPVWKTSYYHPTIHFYRLSELLDLTPLEPDEWHAVVAYHRIINNLMSPSSAEFSYPDNKEFDFQDSQPRELYYLWSYLGQDFRQRFEDKYYTSKC